MAQQLQHPCPQLDVGILDLGRGLPGHALDQGRIDVAAVDHAQSQQTLVKRQRAVDVGHRHGHVVDPQRGRASAQPGRHQVAAGHVVQRLAAAHQLGLAAADQHRRRPRHRVEVSRQRLFVGAGGKKRDHVAGGDPRRQRRAGGDGVEAAADAGHVDQLPASRPAAPSAQPAASGSAPRRCRPDTPPSCRSRPRCAAPAPSAASRAAPSTGAGRRCRRRRGRAPARARSRPGRGRRRAARRPAPSDRAGVLGRGGRCRPAPAAAPGRWGRRRTSSRRRRRSRGASSRPAPRAAAAPDRPAARRAAGTARPRGVAAQVRVHAGQLDAGPDRSRAAPPAARSMGMPGL